MFTRASLTQLIADLADKPPLNAADLKAYFDNSPTELKDAINLLEQELEAVTDGDSGADNIGATPISTSPSTVQGILEWLKLQIDNATTGALPDNSITTAKYQDGSITKAKLETTVQNNLDDNRIQGTTQNQLLQKGSVSIYIQSAISGSVNITFPIAYASPPNVVVSGSDTKAGSATNITTTGCTIVIAGASTSTGTYTTYWQSLGV